MLAINHNSNTTNYYENLKAKREDLKNKNNRVSQIQNYFFDFVQNGEIFEKNKDFYSAINEYDKALRFAYSESILKINNYAHTIHRLIILFGKTKQFDKLKEHLELSIEKHPEFRDVKDWKLRLEKLNNKL